uniref:Replication Factor C Small Subunit n=1 Tax=Florenciella sp. virus SA2 TaxID=3240092 RepID=A0AB39JEG0_9VIRU
MEKDIINKIDNISNNKNLSNILFYGPFLHGKEDICDYLIKSIYNTNQNIAKYVLTINCLSINGIKNIKEYIKLFSMQILNKTDTIKFKTIILKNAEYLTYDSQYSLRRTIEHYNKTTRFILICDNKYKILNPICSRFHQIYIDNHKYNKKYNNYDNFNYIKYNSIMKKYFEKISNDTLTPKDIISISSELYSNNFYAYEIIDKFKKNPNYNNVDIIFDNICFNYKNEIMSIFFLLNVFRNNLKIEISEYY